MVRKDRADRACTVHTYTRKPKLEHMRHTHAGWYVVLWKCSKRATVERMQKFRWNKASTMNNATSNESYDWRKCQFSMQISMLENEINTKFDSYYEPFQLLLLHFPAIRILFREFGNGKKRGGLSFSWNEVNCGYFQKKVTFTDWRMKASFTLQPFHQVQNVIAIDGGIGVIGDEQHECTDSSSTTSLSLLAFVWNSRMFENAFKNSYTNAISDRCFEY